MKRLSGTSKKVRWFILIKSDVQGNKKCIYFKEGVNG